MSIGIGGLFVAIIAVILIALLVAGIGAAVYYYLRDRE